MNLLSLMKSAPDVMEISIKVVKMIAKPSTSPLMPTA